jgi:hypothetical protein
VRRLPSKGRAGRLVVIPVTRKETKQDIDMIAIRLCVNRAPVEFIPNNKRFLLSGTRRSPYHGCREMRELWYQAGLLVLLPCFPSYLDRTSLPASGNRAFISKNHQTPLLYCPAASFNAPDQPILLSFLRQKRLLAGLATTKVLFFKSSMKCPNARAWCSSVPLPHQSMTSVCIRRPTLLRPCASGYQGSVCPFFLGVVGARQMSYTVVLLRPTVLYSYRVVGPVNVIPQSPTSLSDNPVQWRWMLTSY